MANLRENNIYGLRLMLNKDEYWDFFVDKDTYSPYAFGDGLHEDCLISYIDACDAECVSGDSWLFGNGDYSWESGTSVDGTLFNISYVGTDNGLFTFKKDRISNKDFLKIYQDNSYRINGGDLRLKLHAVSGNTQQYDYPLHVENCQIKLNGGFYQGFFETECDEYRVLPNKMDSGIPWEFEFQLKKCDFEAESKKTLNDKYPDNKGIFFYIGTRAENKWVYLYKGEDDCFTLSPDDYVEDSHIDTKDHIIGNFYDPSPDFDNVDFGGSDGSDYEEKEDDDEIIGLDGFIDFEDGSKEFGDWTSDYCSDDLSRKGNGVIERMGDVGAHSEFEETNTSGSTDIDCSDVDWDYWEPELDISDFDYKTVNDISVGDANQRIQFTTDNKFLLFNRTCTGYTTSNWIDGTQMEVYGKKKKFKDNLFVLMNSTRTGYTVYNIDELRNKVDDEYDYSDFYGDLYNNALAFRITDDGKIGYRLLTVDCEKEGEDKTKMEEGYSYPNVIKDCEWQTVHVKIIPTEDTMRLYFYVDGKLVYVTNGLPKLNLRELNEAYEKQEGVPYNISVGGGTQGLAETILPNYMLNPTRTYPLEKYFAGSFIGYFKSFKFYECSLEYGDILSNFRFEKKRSG